MNLKEAIMIADVFLVLSPATTSFTSFVNVERSEVAGLRVRWETNNQIHLLCANHDEILHLITLIQ